MEHMLISIGLSTQLAGDVSVFLILVILGVALGFLIGRYRLASFLLGIYLALVIMEVTPQSVFESFQYANIIVFIGSIVLFTLLDESLFNLQNTSLSAWWNAVILGFLEAGLILSVLVDIFPRRVVSSLISTHALGYFTSTWAMFFWVVTPLIFLLVLNKRWR